MTLVQIRNWLLSRIALEYNTIENNVNPLISKPIDVKWVPQEYADQSVQYVHGKVPVSIETTVGALYIQSYGIVWDRINDEYYPWGEDRKTSGLLAQITTLNTTFKSEAEDYLWNNSIRPYSSTWTIIKEGDRGTVKAFRTVLTVLGNRTRENLFEIWRNGETFAHQVVENVNFTTSAEYL